MMPRGPSRPAFPESTKEPAFASKKRPLDASKRLSHTERRAEAVAELNKGVAIQETYVRRDPADALFRQELAVTLYALGSELAKSRDTATAQAHLQRARAILTPLWQANPRKLTLLRDLANCYEDSGNASTAGADWSGALAWYAKSRELWDTWPTIAISSVFDAAQNRRVTALLENATRKTRAAARQP